MRNAYLRKGQFNTCKDEENDKKNERIYLFLFVFGFCWSKIFA